MIPAHWEGDSGYYDAPRRLLTAMPGVKLVEMENNRERSLCCGAKSLGVLQFG